MNTVEKRSTTYTPKDFTVTSSFLGYSLVNKSKCSQNNFIYHFVGELGDMNVYLNENYEIRKKSDVHLHHGELLIPNLIEIGLLDFAGSHKRTDRRVP